MKSLTNETLNDVKQFSSDKILKHLDRVSDWLKGGNPAPITVEIDMTDICNHRCPECVVNYYQLTVQNYLKKELAESIIDQLGAAKVKGLIFTGGGEPLCNANTPDMVVRARKKGLDVGFITNGALLTEDSAEKILNNSVWMRVSLDAATPEIFKKTHGKGEKEFAKVIDNIKMTVAKKKRLKSNCTIGVGYLTFADTKGDLEEATILCKSLGVDYIQFRPMQIHHGGKFKYNWQDVTKEILECLKHKKDGFDVLYSKHKYDMMHRCDYGRNYKKCYGHQFATVISATGKMYICCHLRGYEKYCIGDLTQNSFIEIWNSEQRKRAYRSINFKDCIPLCRDNTFNQVLWNIKKPSEHVNFL